jgi:hypothetical protein
MHFLYNFNHVGAFCTLFTDRVYCWYTPVGRVIWPWPLWLWRDFELLEQAEVYNVGSNGKLIFVPRVFALWELSEARRPRDYCSMSAFTWRNWNKWRHIRVCPVLTGINWLVFITETECVYCAVRSARTVYLCVLLGSENKQRLFHCRPLNDWCFITQTESVYCEVRT